MIGSRMQAVVEEAVQGIAPPKLVSAAPKPTPHVEEEDTSPVTMERTEPTAEASLAAMRARSKFGIAMAAMIKIIATTISNSINEKPFCFLFIVSPGSLSSEICVIHPGGVRPV